MKILIATHNRGKFGEIMAVLRNLPIEFLSLRDLNITEDVEETGKTHAENAELKARFFAGKSGLPTLGEDSGIYVEAFPDELGVETRRFRGLHNASDKEWISYFMDQMKDVPDEKRNARFVTYSAFLDGAGDIHHFSGETRGQITHKLMAPVKEGIPLSSCFMPEGCDKVYSALTEEEKNKISHRGKAIRQFYDFLIPIRN